MASMTSEVTFSQKIKMASISLIKESRWPSTINKKKKWPLTASEVIILSLNFFSIFLITFCNCTSIGCSSHNGRWRPHIFRLIHSTRTRRSVAAIFCFSVLCFPRMVNFQSSMEFFSTSFQQIYKKIKLKSEFLSWKLWFEFLMLKIRWFEFLSQ